jgi:hypothetical protein
MTNELVAVAHKVMIPHRLAITGDAIDDQETQAGRVPSLLPKKDPKTRKRKNLGTFDTREEAERHERAVQYFKRHP